MQMQPQFERTGTRLYNVRPGLAFTPNALGAAGMQSPHHPTAIRLSGASDTAEVKPAEKKEKETDQKDAEAGNQPPKGRVNAAQLMTVYKCLGPAVAGIGYGLIFKGGSVLFAVMMSLMASSMSVFAVNKIHKEEGPLFKGFVEWSSKVMGLFGKGRQHDHSPAGKEWSMVPVWGLVCGLGGLFEAILNHVYSKKFPTPPVTKLMDKTALANKKGIAGAFSRFRSTCIEFLVNAKNWLKGPFSEAKYLPKLVRQTPKWLIEKMEKDVHGNIAVAYALGALVPFIGALIQAGFFAKIQEKIDARQVEKHKHKTTGHKEHQAERESNKVTQEHSATLTDNQSDAAHLNTPNTNTNEAKDSTKKDEDVNQKTTQDKTELKSVKQTHSTKEDELPNQQSELPHSHEKKTASPAPTKNKSAHKTEHKTESAHGDKSTQAGAGHPVPASSVMPMVFQHPSMSMPNQKSVLEQRSNLIKPNPINASMPVYRNSYELWPWQVPQQSPPFMYFKPPVY